MKKTISILKFDENGLIPAIIQDGKNNEVLMVAYMNEESLLQTLETGRVSFWSRSRKKLWVKGETSRHTQTVKQMLIDCDNDAVLIKVEQKGGACHMGFRSCFYRQIQSDGTLKKVKEKVFKPEEVYK
ncbi:phosphoribosyl-AMP cyclohydrolase [bacterium Unc6]|nr:phosphoribosyl-AMP cyclohydrolase [bacterium Unc6]